MRTLTWLLSVLLLAAAAAALWWRTTAFGAPLPGVALLQTGLLTVLLGYEWHQRRAGRARWAADDLLARMGEPRLGAAALLRAVYLGAALILLLGALARPKGGLGQTLVTSTGVDLVVCLDVSNSMRCADMNGQPRLEAAKRLLSSFIESSPNDRIGLVAFAGTAHTVCPLTLDQECLLSILDDLDYHTPAKQGTMLGEAVNAALGAFGPPGKAGQVIVLVTDGEDQGSDCESAASAAAQRSVILHTIGLGSEAGANIPLPGGPKEYDGKPVVSRLDERRLRLMSSTTGGRYFRADSPARLAEVLGAIHALTGQATASRQVENQLDVFTWYLLPAFALLLLEPLLALRGRRRRLP